MANRKRYRIYKNLHKGQWSIVDIDAILVVGYSREIIMEECRFVVQTGGKKRAMREHVRNVHAFVEGVPVIVKDFQPYKGREVLMSSPTCLSVTNETAFGVRYDPFVDRGFYTVYNNKDVHQSELVHFIIDNLGKTSVNIS